MLYGCELVHIKEKIRNRQGKYNADGVGASGVCIIMGTTTLFDFLSIDVSAVAASLYARGT